jgi:hypothetical protein
MKWGTKFPAEFVNRLHRMVDRHLSRPHRFVCFTDDPSGLEPAIEHFPMPSAGPADRDPTHGWRKVSMFRKPLGDLEGSTLFLDLDVVITEALDPFFELPGTARVIRDYRPVRIRGDSWVGNTSVFRFEVGAHPEVLEGLERNFDAIRKRFRNEQEYVTHWFHERGELGYWPEAWCPSFKHDCVPVGPLSYFLTPRLPRGARVVVFHGVPNPGEALRGHRGKWYRRIRPTPWIGDHWR